MEESTGKRKSEESGDRHRSEDQRNKHIEGTVIPHELFKVASSTYFYENLSICTLIKNGMMKFSETQ